MPKYLLVREVGEVTEEDLKAGFDKGEEVGTRASRTSLRRDRPAATGGSPGHPCGAVSRMSRSLKMVILQLSVTEVGKSDRFWRNIHSALRPQ